MIVEVCKEMENFCNVSCSISEQHVDSRESRITTDSADLEKLLQFFNMYNLFPETPNIMSIFSGIVGNYSINCYRANEVGMKSILGQDLKV